jgi:hypothetical protein
MTDLAPERALAAVTRELASRGRRFALVGGLAVSVRAEVRFTRDVDLAVVTTSDEDSERLVYDLRQVGYVPLASVEHETQHRLSTVLLRSPDAVRVDLLFASSGIETEIVAGATLVEFPGAGPVSVAAAEELLAMKVLSLSPVRLQDRIDAQRLCELVTDLDLDRVRRNLATITSRGYDRNQDLSAKLDAVLREIGQLSEG